MLGMMADTQVSLGDHCAALSTIRYAMLFSMGYSTFSFFSTLCQIVRVPGKIADATTANDALDLAEQMFAKEMTKEKGGCTSLTWLTYLAEAQATGGRRDKAAHTLRSALDLVSSDSYDFRKNVVDDGYSEIAAVQTRIGDLPGALQTLERMSKNERNKDGLARIASELAYCGDLLGAFSLVARIDSAEPKIYALLWIARAQAEHGDIVGAKKTFARIEPFSRKSYRCGKSIGLFYCALARAEAQRGDTESTRRALAEILHIIDNALLGPWLTTEVYTAVAEAYATVGMIEDARRVFERPLCDADTRRGYASLARKITKAHTAAGDVAVAEAWIQTLPGKDSQFYAWLGIVDGLFSLSQNTN
jgi:tetratricopeptide (TPR) repeat protein